MAKKKAVRRPAPAPRPAPSRAPEPSQPFSPEQRATVWKYALVAMIFIAVGGTVIGWRATSAPATVAVVSPPVNQPVPHVAAPARVAPAAAPAATGPEQTVTLPSGQKVTVVGLPADQHVVAARLGRAAACPTGRALAEPRPAPAGVERRWHLRCLPA